MQYKKEVFRMAKVVKKAAVKKAAGKPAKKPVAKKRGIPVKAQK